MVAIFSRICFAVRPSVDSNSSAIPVNTTRASVRTRTRQNGAQIDLFIDAAHHTPHRYIAARSQNGVLSGSDSNFADRNCFGPVIKSSAWLPRRRRVDAQSTCAALGTPCILKASLGRIAL